VGFRSAAQWGLYQGTPSGVPFHLNNFVRADQMRPLGQHCLRPFGAVSIIMLGGTAEAVP